MALVASAVALAVTKVRPESVDSMEPRHHKVAQTVVTQTAATMRMVQGSMGLTTLEYLPDAAEGEAAVPMAGLVDLAVTAAIQKVI